MSNCLRGDSLVRAVFDESPFSRWDSATLPPEGLSSKFALYQGFFTVLRLTLTFVTDNQMV